MKPAAMEHPDSALHARHVRLFCFVVGGAWYWVLFGLAFAGAWRGILGVVVAKAFVAAMGAYVSKRVLQLSDGALLEAFGAYEVGAVLMGLWALFNFVSNGYLDFNPLPWFLPALSDLAAGCLGYWRAIHETRREA